jgi:hypothetical protein
LTPTSLVAKKVGELSTRPAGDTWAACAAVWAHVFVLAGPGWRRWPHVYRTAGDALAAALRTATGGLDPDEAAGLVARLDEFDVEDDGSAQWQHVIDLISMLLGALSGEDAAACATTTLTTYLEGTFTVIANDLATRDGRPISQLQAADRVPEDERWQRAVALVDAL